MSTTTSASTAARRNRLAVEHSPYLLQHQYNPVEWFPWGEEAFVQARQTKRPIFLSIGYSTCHWCHVMERESFEDPQTAALLNAHFVSIKVDREERPDVDKIYMTFVQAMTGQGGWPLNVFLTPDLKPFYGGTYWPPDQRHGRPAFTTVLQQVHQAWTQRHAQVLTSAADMHQRLAQALDRAPDVALPLSAGVLDRGAAALKAGYDPINGGWGQAPKFPSPTHPSCLLSYGARTGDREAVNMVLHTCKRMANGGIYDQLGGGFHRYSVDEKWLVPHFEKMLYDNAQLLGLYLDCYLVSGEEAFASVAHDILRYVLRDMQHPEGGFYSAEDADSEGKEGKFYCWTHAELSQLLTPTELEITTRAFGITATGNFIDHSDPNPLAHQNVLSVVVQKLAPEDIQKLQSAKEKMLKARAKRVRPLLDDKILTSWNGLMLATLSRAYATLGRPEYRAAAERNLSFLQAKLWDASTETLHHRWRAGTHDSAQLLEAYAYLLAGVLELYQTTLTPGHLTFAVALAESMLRRFYDQNHGGFWQSPVDTKDLILQVKEESDGAEPSGNAVAIQALLKLATITGRAHFRSAAEKSLQLFAERIDQLPQAVPGLLVALDLLLQGPRSVVLAGDITTPKGQALLQTAHRVYQPNKVVLAVAGPVNALAGSLRPIGAEATAYLCTATACQPPTSDPEQLKAWLR